MERKAENCGNNVAKYPYKLNSGFSCWLSLLAFFLVPFWKLQKRGGMTLNLELEDMASHIIPMWTGVCGIHVCMHKCGGVAQCSHMWGPYVDLDITFLCHSPPYFLRQGLSLNLGVTMLPDQYAPGIALSLPPQHWD